MSLASDGEPTVHVADRLYAARCVVADSIPGRPRVGVAEFVQFLADPGTELSLEAQRALF